MNCGRNIDRRKFSLRRLFVLGNLASTWQISSFDAVSDSVIPVVDDLIDNVRRKESFKAFNLINPN